MTKAEIEFASPEELAAIMERIGSKLHAKNRIAGEESGVVWHFAEAIRAMGKLAKRIATEPELHLQYGDGYQAGLLPEQVQQEHFLGIFAEALAERR